MADLRKPENLRKLKDQAADHAVKGRFERAAELLSVVVAADPRDLLSRQKLGDALRRSGDARDATRVYREVADAYAAKGELIKAIAVCKVILDLDPKHQATQSALADLYARRKQEPSRPVGITPGAGLDAFAAPAAQEVTLEVAAQADDDETTPSDWLEPSRAVPPPTRPRRAEAPARRPGADRPPDVTIELSLVEEIEPEEEPEVERNEHVERSFAAAPRRDTFSTLPHGDTGPISRTPTAAPAQAATETPAPAPTPAATETPTPGWSPTATRTAISDDDEPLEVRRPVNGVTFTLPEADEPLAPPAASERVAARPAEPLASPPAAQPDAPARLPHVPLFSDLSREAFMALASRLTLRAVPAGSAVITEGERGQSLFVVVSGRFRVERSSPVGPLLLAHVGEGEFFGEMALLSGEARMASVVAEADSELLEVRAEVLAELCRTHRSVAASLTRFYRSRLLVNATSTSPVFRPFSPADRGSLVRRFQSREVRAGEVVVREGEPSDGLFVVLTGRFDVVRGSGKDAIRVAELREGDLFGEISCLRRQPASASVLARRRGIVLRLPRSDFAEIASSHPQVLELVSDLAEQRQQTLGGAASPPPYVV